MDEHHAFDRAYWDEHYRYSEPGHGAGPGTPHPYLAQETAGLTPGTALEAGCGEGAEAIWLAGQGWDVTAVDLAVEALARARAAAGGGAAVGAAQTAAAVRWVEADLSTWQPDRSYDLVTTFYAHPAIPQLDFYERLAGWVAPGGTLLVVGHRSGEATVAAAAVAGRLDADLWEVVTAEEHTRTLTHRGVDVPLHDVVVRAVRRPSRG